MANSIDVRVPVNPKYSNIQTKTNTGKTAAQVAILSNQHVARKRGETFRRVKPSTVIKLIEELGTAEFF